MGFATAVGLVRPAISAGWEMALDMPSAMVTASPTQMSATSVAAEILGADLAVPPSPELVRTVAWAASNGVFMVTSTRTGSGRIAPPRTDARRIDERMRALQKENEELARQSQTLLGELRKLEIERDLLSIGKLAVYIAAAGLHPLRAPLPAPGLGRPGRLLGPRHDCGF